MNNKTVISLSLFALGVGIGIGFLFAKNYYESIIEEEIESVKEHFGVGAYREEDQEEAEDVTLKTNPMSRSSLDGNPYEQAKVNYNLSSPGNKLPESIRSNIESGSKFVDGLKDAAGMTEQDPSEDSDEERTEPYVITDVEFNEEFDNHDKLSLYYYKLDDTLCDDGEELVDDADQLIGEEAMSLLATHSTVYVRNEPIAADYEIVAINGSYAETVFGTIAAVDIAPRVVRKRDNDEE